MSLRRVSFAVMARAIPRLHEQFLTRIPAGYWTVIEEGVVQVRCPCGHKPLVPYAIPTPCACERWFLYEGRGVRVARYAEALAG
jgi:hypothetical protein